MAQAFQKGEGGGKLPPYGEDFFQRIVGVHWPTKAPPQFIAEQALISTELKNAFALDSGDTFSGMNTGASGFLKSSKAWTVLTAGLVAFGKPRDGDACFMVCSDRTSGTIQRGIEDVGGESGIAWSTVYSVPANSLYALSFAGNAFFISYSSDTGHPSSCAVSFDGENFTELGNIYSVSGTPGSVANNGIGYAAIGDFPNNPSAPAIVADDDSMMWSSSNDGTSWSGGHSSPETANPGISIALNPSLAGGMGRFVGAADDHSKLFPYSDTQQTNMSTAAAAVSSDGRSWTTAALPGAVVGYYDNVSLVHGDSNAQSVCFVRTTGSNGYFVMTGIGVHQPEGTFESYIWRGNGSSWSLVQSIGPDTGLDSFTAVSAIARDLSSTTIVQV